MNDTKTPVASERPMEKIGNKILAYRSSFLVPRGEVAKMSFRLLGDLEDMHLIVELVDDLEDTDENERPRTSLNISGKGNTGKATFINWNNPLGASMIKPIEFGLSDDGRAIHLLAAVWKMGEVHKMDIQVMQEDYLDD